MYVRIDMNEIELSIIVPVYNSEKYLLTLF